MLQHNPLRLARILLKTYGLRGVARRGLYEVRRRFGWFRSHPRAKISAVPSARPVRYAPLKKPDLDQERVSIAIDRARRVVDGCYEAFGHDWRRFPEGQLQWSTHPNTRFHFGDDVWWKVPHLPPGSDIKDVWEPGRFAWVYDLIRAYSLTGDSAYVDTFHRRLASWQAANPPFYGAQWACGQETAIRAIAILHAEDVLLPCSDDAVERIVAVLGWSGERIADATGYALSQRNNHGLSEAAGLIHIGIRLKNLHPDAERWLENGCAWIEEQIGDQFYIDGWYAQHSLSYMRIALEQALLAQRALRAVGRSLSGRSLDRLAGTVRLLALLVDSRTGHVPNHGANDGARIAPLSVAPFRDFRPILTLAAIVLGVPLPADIAADPEIVAWLGGAAPNAGPARQDGVNTGASGWAVARIGHIFVFLCAGSYRHRPSHLDLLHVDVRIDADEVIVDPGTFAYNAAPPWDNPFTSARAHNGPVLDGQEPAERGPRFLWYTWPEARLCETAYENGRVLLVAEVPGRVVRRLVVTGEGISVSDTVLDSAVSRLEVTWLVNPGGCGAVDAEEAQVIEAAEDEPLGWYSPTYKLRQPARLVHVSRTRSARGLEIETTIRPIRAEPA